MRILVGNNRLENPGGSETYTYAIVKELVDRGHDVVCIAKGKNGMVSRKINELGVDVRFKPIDGKFDLALLSHSTSIKLAEKVKAFKVQTCHGIFPLLEQPVQGMDKYVAITEEVGDHLVKFVEPIRFVLIRNGVDCNRFYCKKEVNTDLRVVLSLVHNDMVNFMIQSVCKELGLRCIVKNKYIKPIWDIETLINLADVVVTLGRGAYEAMACERNVYVLDQRSYVTTENKPIGDGMVTTENFHLFKTKNFTGRFSNKIITHKILKEDLSNKYNKEHGKELREKIFKDYNIKHQVSKYLSLLK